MAKKIDRNNYDIRTLTYYQREGGVYNDIITILTKMRGEPQFRGMPSPAKALNNGCYWWDVIWENWCNDNNCKYFVPNGLTDSMSLCIVACIASTRTDVRYYLNAQLDDLYYFVQELQKMLEKDKLYYPFFKEFIETKQSEYRNGLNDLQNQVHREEVNELKTKAQMLECELMVKAELIAKQNERIAEQSQMIDSQQTIISELNRRLSLAEKSSYEGSTFDRLLTLDAILDWIRGRHHYNYTEQVFRMLADFKDKVATDEERGKIIELENEMLDRNQVQAVFNQNFALNSNMMTGMVSNPQLPIGMTPAEVQQLICQFLNNLSNGQQ